jgi:type II secretory pathway component PulK
VALLVVLILLVMMSALAAKISQQFCRNLQKTHYQVSQQQLRWAMQAQEKVVKDRLQSDASGETRCHRKGTGSSRWKRRGRLHGGKPGRRCAGLLQR